MKSLIFVLHTCIFSGYSISSRSLTFVFFLDALQKAAKKSTNVKELLEIEQPENIGVKYKYKAFRVGPMRLKIVRQPNITHEQNS